MIVTGEPMIVITFVPQPRPENAVVPRTMISPKPSRLRGHTYRNI